MLRDIVDSSAGADSIPIAVKAGLSGYAIVDRSGKVSQASGALKQYLDSPQDLESFFPMLRKYIDNPHQPGGFYNLTDLTILPNYTAKQQAVYASVLPESGDILLVKYDINAPNLESRDANSEIFILSLIAQAVRAFNKADSLESVLKIVLIGVTAGSGLGFNRSFILLTCDEKNCLKGALANGPASPEEANFIWQKLSRGETTLKKMFDDALQNNYAENPSINSLLERMIIPLERKDNLFVKAALEKKSMIIDGATLASSNNSEIRAIIGPGPMAVVPLVGEDYLQGVLIADNFITRKEITENDLHLLEIFARYASDSIKNFRLYENLERKVEALKHANEMIISSRENLIKAERLSVLAEMAGDVAHEIRNPLTIIGGFAKSMLKKMSPDNENYEYLELIFSQVERISQSLEKFTSLVNYESASNRVCDLCDIVKSAVAVRIPGIEPSRFAVNCNTPILVNIDPDLFRQALLIVMRRACALAESDKVLSLSVTQIDNRAIVYFGASKADNDHVELLYKSFYSGKSHELLKQLSTSLEILKYYKGNIGIEAGENDIKRFYMELPVHKEDK